MVELTHILPAPASLIAHRASHPVGPWSTLPPVPEKREVRHQLNLEQDGLCIYCENSLAPDEGHVEHIKSKTLNPPLTFAYDNLAHACGETVRCGHFKKRNALPIEPRAGNSRFFALSAITGILSPDIKLQPHEQKDADETLRILGLNNEPGLNRQRQQFAFTVRSLDPSDVPGFLAMSPFRWSLRKIA
jgi:uncharacterized protein (TIGR02646 family)